MSEIKRLVRLYQEVDGRFEDMEFEFELEELGNVIPDVGDLIIEPGVTANLDRRDPRTRDVYQVMSRYFMPHARTDEYRYIALVVWRRAGRREEQEFFLVA